LSFEATFVTDKGVNNIENQLSQMKKLKNVTLNFNECYQIIGIFEKKDYKF